MHYLKRIPAAFAAAYRAFVAALRTTGGGGGPVEPF